MLASGPVILRSTPLRSSFFKISTKLAPTRRSLTFGNQAFNMSTRATATQLQALSAFGACDVSAKSDLSSVRRLKDGCMKQVSDALVKLKYPHGGHIPDIDLLSPASKHTTKIIGEAFTVQVHTTALHLSSS